VKLKCCDEININLVVGNLWMVQLLGLLLKMQVHFICGLFMRCMLLNCA